MQIDTTANTPTLNSLESPLNTAISNSKIVKKWEGNSRTAIKKKGLAFARPFSMKSYLISALQRYAL